MIIRIGMSGYSYKEWKPNFYPADLKADKMLGFYSERFGAVEINNTFYRMPTEKVLMQWQEEVPPGFLFGLKAPRRITHMNRLRESADSVEYFMRTASCLGERLGPTLFQLPPNFKKDLPLLQEFLSLVPRRWVSAFEFRHQSWFEDDVYEALRGHDVALCIVDDEDGGTPMVATASWGYLRLRRTDYSPADLEIWAERIRGEQWERAFAFFKHEEDGGLGPHIGMRMKAIIG
ncbi:MAG: DUF72 domain-containing protein [Gemmatimonadota bacterium]